MKKAWERRFKYIAAVSLILVIATMILEIILTSFPDGERKQMEIQEWFLLFAKNPFMGMRNLGLLNIIATTLMIPVFYDIYLVHENKVLGLFGLLFLILFDIFSSFIPNFL